jgi:tRNA-specific 2-thiouridylase
MTKGEVRAAAAALGLPTATKPDSQEVCFIRRAEGRGGFVGDRMALTPGRVVDTEGKPVGTVAAVELVTIGQRRGLGLPGGHDPRYVLDVDVAAGVVTVGTEADLLVAVTDVGPWTWAAGPAGGRLLGQTSAHGVALAVDVDPDAGRVRWAERRRRIAPGQLVVLYDGDEVVGSALAA